MSNNVQDIKSRKKPYMLLFRWYYQCKRFDANNMKIDEKSYKKFLFTTLDM